ncbi:MAG TPA: hypothetical protein ENI76_02005 [Ignavibacteria bacterium]|nr:hypothetical protein [Ignavibacteria bacterium]
MTGSLRDLFKEIIFYLVDHPVLTIKALKELSQAFCEAGYSYKRARSYKSSSMGKALKKMEKSNNAL